MDKKLNKFLKEKTTTFYLATNLFPKKVRQDVKKLYYFLRSVDDVVDEEKDIKKFNQICKDIVEEKESKYDFVNLALELKKNYKIEKKYLLDFLKTQKKDLESKTVKIKNKKELIEYCYGVAGIVGVFMIKIFKLKKISKDILDSAIRFGIFMQLVNILRDIKEDFKKNRIYIPQYLLKKHSIKLEKIEPKSYQKMINEYCKIAMDELNKVNFNYLPNNLRKPNKIAKDIYMDILNQIKKNPIKYYEKKYKTSKIKLKFIVFKNLLLK